MSAEVIRITDVRVQHRKLAEDLRRNIDAESTIVAVTDLFVLDTDFQDALNSLPDDLRSEVAQYGRERLWTLGYPRPKRKVAQS
ncbi:hypothetical protein [Methylobacterium sp. 17Sr1-1]|uniref:hypothetical protein n=1 Tax=Methylobacterium sp. 17Sr1-1 TaxID=2202826 RepID=UPI0013A5AA16|nr:hypothetical protein [Methylobacterium sp. 17Sr1-1]